MFAFNVLTRNTTFSFNSWLTICGYIAYIITVVCIYRQYVAFLHFIIFVMYTVI